MRNLIERKWENNLQTELAKNGAYAGAVPSASQLHPAGTFFFKAPLALFKAPICFFETHKWSFLKAIEAFGESYYVVLVVAVVDFVEVLAVEVVVESTPFYLVPFSFPRLSSNPRLYCGSLCCSLCGSSLCNHHPFLFDLYWSCLCTRCCS